MCNRLSVVVMVIIGCDGDGTSAVTACHVVIICSRKVKRKDKSLVASNGIVEIRNFSKISPAVI
jgi:hypothetical protein